VGVSVLVLIAFFSISVQANSYSILEFDCSNTIYERDLLVCAKKHLEQAEGELNKKLIQLEISLDEKHILRLNNVQVSWLKYRDQSCVLETTESETGTGFPSIYAFCLLIFK